MKRQETSKNAGLPRLTKCGTWLKQTSRLKILKRNRRLMKRSSENLISSSMIIRLMFGSDWPVCLLAARGYDEVVDLVESWAGGLGSTAQEMLFGGNAANIYRLS